MKYISYLLFTLILFMQSSCSNNSTLNITDVDVTPTRKYGDIAKALLGKKVNLVFYDKSLSCAIDGGESLIFKQNKEGNYIADDKFIKINKTLGHISDILITVIQVDNKEAHLHDQGYGALVLATTTIKITAKP
ncbi:MAG: hypothetical protein JWR38_1964 [Mucilaginibacter sp.]|nr:hypothetical protein [Mucilaginibacter sp.]